MCVLSGCDGATEVRYRLSRFEVHRCRECGMMVRQPFPDSEELRRMYDDPEYHGSAYFSSQFEATSAVSSPERVIYSDALDWLDEFAARRGGRCGTLLDVGCGSGFFLRLARERGWDVEGVEYSVDLSRRAREAFDLTIAQGDFLTTTPNRARYDVVTMWDFLEHVLTPQDVLRRARSLLADDGILVVFTIDCASLFNVIGAATYAATFGRFSRPLELLYDARHNFYFTSQTLRSLISEAGLAVLAAQSYRAHLARWLSEPAPAWLTLGGDLVDLASVAVRRQYRQLMYCSPAVLKP